MGQVLTALGVVSTFLALACGTFYWREPPLSEHGGIGQVGHDAHGFLLHYGL